MKIRIFVCAFVMVSIAAIIYTWIIPKDDEKLQKNDFLKACETLNCDKSKSCTWIKIPDTNIDYQVLRPKDNNYYLRRNASGKFDRNGAIFYDCDTSSGDGNAVIYGHNMQNNKMFSELEFYRKEAFVKSHNFIYIMDKRGSKVSKQKYLVKAWMLIDDKFSKKKLDELKKSFVNRGRVQGGVSQIKCYGDIDGNKSIMLITCASRRTLEDKRILVYAEKS